MTIFRHKKSKVLYTIERVTGKFLGPVYVATEFFCNNRRLDDVDLSLFVKVATYR